MDKKAELAAKKTELLEEVVGLINAQKGHNADRAGFLADVFHLSGDKALLEPIITLMEMKPLRGESYHRDSIWLGLCMGLVRHKDFPRARELLKKIGDDLKKMRAAGEIFLATRSSFDETTCNLIFATETKKEGTHGLLPLEFAFTKARAGDVKAVKEVIEWGWFRDRTVFNEEWDEVFNEKRDEFLLLDALYRNGLLASARDFAFKVSHWPHERVKYFTYLFEHSADPRDLNSARQHARGIRLEDQYRIAETWVNIFTHSRNVRDMRAPLASLRHDMQDYRVPLDVFGALYSVTKEPRYLEEARKAAVASDRRYFSDVNAAVHLSAWTREEEDIGRARSLITKHGHSPILGRCMREFFKVTGALEDLELGLVPIRSRYSIFGAKGIRGGKMDPRQLFDIVRELLLFVAAVSKKL